MKIIEAMGKIKANKEKIADLQGKIAKNSAHLSYETPEYGTAAEVSKKLEEWAQSCEYTAQENIRLLMAISRTNLATDVTIEIGGQEVTKKIAAWVLRRGNKTTPGYAATDLKTWSSMTDRGLKEGNINSSTGIPTEVKLVRNYNPVRRDKKTAEYQSEPHQINARLEVVNAETDLIEAD